MSDNSGPAFPETCTSYDSDREPYVSSIGGLTKRELFAAMIMSGLAANPASRGSARVFANDAVEGADALIKALEAGDG